VHRSVQFWVVWLAADKVVDLDAFSHCIRIVSQFSSKDGGTIFIFSSTI
jgi:hypothetical protein